MDPLVALAVAAVALIAATISAVLGSVGPVVAPVFLAYGLVGGAYVGTEALTALAMHLTTTAAYGRLSLLDGSALVLGTALGALLTVGSYLGKNALDRLSPVSFVRLAEPGIADPAQTVGAGVVEATGRFEQHVQARAPNHRARRPCHSTDESRSNPG